MRAVILKGAGGPEVISIGEVPKPEVKPGHIRVRVRAAGLNRADILQRQGHYPAPPGWPADIPGLEYAGEVEAVRDTTRWKVGDRVITGPFNSVRDLQDGDEVRVSEADGAKKKS